MENLCKTCIHAVFVGNKPTYCYAMVKPMNRNSYCQLYEAIITEEEFLEMMMKIREGLIE